MCVEHCASDDWVMMYLLSCGGVLTCRWSQRHITENKLGHSVLQCDRKKSCVCTQAVLPSAGRWLMSSHCATDGTGMPHPRVPFARTQTGLGPTSPPAAVCYVAFLCLAFFPEDQSQVGSKGSVFQAPHSAACLQLTSHIYERYMLQDRQ